MMIKKLLAVGLVLAISVTAMACTLDGEVADGADTGSQPAEQSNETPESQDNDTVDEAVETNETVDIGDMI